MPVAHPVPAAPLDILPVPLGGLEIILVIRLDAVELAEGLRLQLDSPGRQATVNLRLKPFIGVLLCAFQRGTLRIVLPDVLDKIFRVLPIRLVGANRENLISVRPIGYSRLFALSKGLHSCQAFIRLLMEILRV